MKYKFEISGIDCAHCAAKLEDRMSKIDQVDSVKINFLSEKIIVVSSLSKADVLQHVSDCAKAFDKNIEIK